MRGEAARNVALWFLAVLLSVSLFSLFFGLGAFTFVFRVTMIFASPAALLYLPFVVTLADAEDGRIWTILSSGILIGPTTLVLWAAFLSVIGNISWQGNDLGPGLGACLIMALIVGCMTTAFYVAALKIAVVR